MLTSPNKGYNSMRLNSKQKHGLMIPEILLYFQGLCLSSLVDQARLQNLLDLSGLCRSLSHQLDYLLCYEPQA